MTEVTKINKDSLTDWGRLTGGNANLEYIFFC
jgi:hypothetical protein